MCSVLLVCMFFVFKVTATPEIYTDVHMRARRDALLVGAARTPAVRLVARAGGRRAGCATAHPRRAGPQRRRHLCGDRGPLRRRPVRSGAARSRSEEHTSEIQSLMRISYAVFCFKKKNQNT